MAKEKKAKSKSRPRADSGGLVFEGLNDPALLEFIRSGQIGGGVGIDGRQALCNAALYRCITLISQSIGMLPLNVLHNDDGRETATEHPVWKLLKRQPNKFQTAYEFKSLLQSHVLQYGNSGKANAGRFMILEEGLKAEKWGNTASDAQHIENRNHQIEEIARMFGVPRPLLMMDDTSWGSGISELGVFFLKYGLLPWFTMWEQALTRSLLNPAEQDRLIFKFNAGALLRGSLENQAEFFAKALGSGGHGAWMTQNEVREISDLPKSTDKSADTLRQAQQGKNYEPEKTAAD